MALGAIMNKLGKIAAWRLKEYGNQKRINNFQIDAVIKPKGRPKKNENDEK